MNHFALWRYEARRVGRPTLLAPALLTAVVAGGAVLARRPLHAGTVAHALLFAVEMVVPLAAGVSVASLVGRDPAVELQLTVPTGYRRTLLRRSALAAADGCLVAFAVCVALMAGGWWSQLPRTHGALLGQLTWLSATCWLAALGLLAGAALRTPAAAATVVVAPWLAEQLLPAEVQAHHWSRLLYLFATTEGDNADWTANRFTLLGCAVPLLAAGWLLLSRPERLLIGKSE
jgi:hypothetical protein